MPRRDPSAYVWDVLEACRVLVKGVRGVSKRDYVENDMRRLATERLLNIGEAMNNLDKIDAAMAAELGDVAEIVAFRNVLVHGYFKIDHNQVWEVLQNDSPPLHAAAARVWARFAPLYPDETP